MNITIDLFTGNSRYYGFKEDFAIYTDAEYKLSGNFLIVHHSNKEDVFNLVNIKRISITNQLEDE